MTTDPVNSFRFWAMSIVQFSSNNILYILGLAEYDIDSIAKEGNFFKVVSLPWRRKWSMSPQLK